MVSNHSQNSVFLGSKLYMCKRILKARLTKILFHIRSLLVNASPEMARMRIAGDCTEGTLETMIN